MFIMMAYMSIFIVMPIYVLNLLYVWFLWNKFFSDDIFTSHGLHISQRLKTHLQTLQQIVVSEWLLK